MIRLFRAASFAAAAFVFVFGAPSLAWESTGMPLPTVIADSAAGIAEPIGAPPPAASAPPVAAALPAPAAEPDKPVPASLDALVARHAGTRTADADHECLAGAVYFESKGEPLRGQLSVAEVILNRM